MKSLSLPFIGIIGTLTILAGIVLPPAIIKTTIDKETVFTYLYEKAQQSFLTLLYLDHNGKSSYSILSEDAFFNYQECNSQSDCPTGFTCDATSKKCTDARQETKAIKQQFEKLDGKYCITIEGPEKIFSKDSENIIKNSCNPKGVNFKTILVLPYNKEAITKLVRVSSG